MGRGRQKAKQTKVARQLKYFSPNTDYAALQRELTGSSDHVDHHELDGEEYDADDEYEDDGDEQDLDDDEADWSPPQRR